MKVKAYKRWKRLMKAVTRIEAFMNDQESDRKKAQELTSAVRDKTTELGAAIPKVTP